MKILVVSNMYPSDKVPNYGTFVKNFCDELTKINLNFDKVVIKKKSVKPIGIITYLNYYFKIILILLFKKYDRVYVHYASHSALPLILMNKIKMLSIYTNVHGGDAVPQTETQKKMQKYTKKLLEISTKVIVPSSYFKKIINENYNIPENKIEIYPSAGVKEEYFYPYSPSDKKGIKIQGKVLNKENKYIGFIGRIEQGKGWDVYLKAIYKLKKENKLSGIKSIIIGSGEEYNKFLNEITKFGLENDVILINTVSQNKLSEIYNCLDVFCFPITGKESLGLVALEAMACGIPVISSDYAAPKDYIIEGYNGFKFEVGNFDELSNKLDKFFNLSSSKLNQLRKNAYNTGSNFYTKSIQKELKKILS